MFTCIYCVLYGAIPCIFVLSKKEHIPSDKADHLRLTSCSAIIQDMPNDVVPIQMLWK